jgi:hypothetical protein
MQGIVARMKKHCSQCWVENTDHTDEEIDSSGNVSHIVANVIVNRSHTQSLQSVTMPSPMQHSFTAVQVMGRNADKIGETEDENNNDVSDGTDIEGKPEPSEHLITAGQNEKEPVQQPNKTDSAVKISSNKSALHTRNINKFNRTGIRKQKFNRATTGAKKLSKAIDTDIICTSDWYKKRIDQQLGRFLYTTNRSFSHADHPELVKLCSLLRPGYSPPSHKHLGGQILNNIYMQQLDHCKSILTGKTVSMSLDGWSNVHNEPIECCTVALTTGEIYLMDSVDTSGHPYDNQYLTQLAVDAIRKCQKEFGAEVRSFVTDNASNVAKMRKNLEENKEGIDVITYRCSAHLLNLLSAELERIVTVAKYFHNKPPPAAWYKSGGGSKLILPQEVRWNTVHDCIDSFLKNRGVLVQITQDHKEEIDNTICATVNDMQLVMLAKDFMAIMKPTAVALDRAQ